MFVSPAIDIKDGKCVRLFQGDFDKVTAYDDNPVMVAKRFAESGAELLHVIDLDGAKAGKPVNGRLVRDIAAMSGVPLQAGGGIRTYEAAKTYLDAGVRRVILSTAAIKDPGLVARLIKEFGVDRIVVAADIKNGRFAIDGWVKSGGATVQGSIALLRSLGVDNVLVTDISKDGTLRGPNLGLVKRFVDAGFRVTAAGGVATRADIVRLNKLGAHGAVAGKAVYEGVLDIGQARSAGYANNLAKRIIPCLDVKGGRVVKGTKFTGLKDAGDPVGLAKRYSLGGADELVFLDITATLEGRKTFLNLVGSIAKTIDIPFTVGGGITGLDDIRELLKAGADKVSIGSAAVLKPGLVKQAVDYFGSQCIVISVDAKQKGGGWVVYIKGGTESTETDVLDFCEDMERAGVGELLVNSLDRDGTDSGFDIRLLRAVTGRVNVPVIASSGGGSPQDFAEVFERTDVDAALGASIFHYRDVRPSSLKEYLAGRNIRVRP